MPAWTEEDIIARGQRYLADQAAERIRFNGEVTHVGTATIPTWSKEGRIKGVAPAADRTYDNRVYHSKSEMVAAMQLDFQLRAGLIRRWTPQVPYPIIVNGERVCKVVVDFEVENLDGSIEAIEVKGFQTELYRLKAKLLKACYPKLVYKVVRAV